MKKKFSVIGFGKIGQAISANILQRGIEIAAIDINKDLSDICIKKKFAISEPGLEKLFNSGVRYLIDGRNALSKSDIQKNEIKYIGIER